jgi:hypothetical protein
MNGLGGLPRNSWLFGLIGVGIGVFIGSRGVGRRGMLTGGLLFGILGGLGSELLGRQRLASHHSLFSILFFGMCGILVGSLLSSQKSKAARLFVGGLCCASGGMLVSQSPIGGFVGGLVGAGLGFIIEERSITLGMICFGALGVWLSTLINQIDLPLIMQLDTLVGALFLGMASGCCDGLLSLLPKIVGTRRIAFKRPSWSWLRLYYSRFNYYREHIAFLVGTVAIGLLVGILYGAMINLIYGTTFLWLYKVSITRISSIITSTDIFRILFMSIVGSLFMLTQSISQTNIVPVETFSWSWRHAIRRLATFSSGGLFSGILIEIVLVILSLPNYTVQSVLYLLEGVLSSLPFFCEAVLRYLVVSATTRAIYVYCIHSVSDGIMWRSQGLFEIRNVIRVSIFRLDTGNKRKQPSIRNKRCSDTT